MPIFIRARLATQPDSTSLESLATLANGALASENDAKKAHMGVAEIQVNESTNFIGLIEDISGRLQQLETSGAKKKHFSHKPSAENTEH